MASNTKGLRLLKSMELLKIKPSFDANNVLQKVDLQSLCNGVLKCSFKVEPTMCNVGGALHGGYIASVADVISFYSMLSNPDGKFSWTTTLNMTYIKASRAGDTVNVETKTLVNGVSPITETYFRNSDGKLLAKGIATFFTANEKMQQYCKEMYNFDVHEKYEQ